MWFVLRLVLLFVVVYSVATASPAQRAAMWRGGEAFIGSIQDACLRTTACQRAVYATRDFFADPARNREVSSDLRGYSRGTPLLER